MARTPHQMPTKEQIEAAIADLTKKYPGRWREAVTNPALRGWFATKASKELGCSTAANRAAISYALDQRALNGG
jgi:DNA-directed RNA polymerase specialized sigma24 family protein